MKLRHVAMFSSEPHSLGDVDALGRSESEQDDSSLVMADAMSIEIPALATQVDSHVDAGKYEGCSVEGARG